MSLGGEDGSIYIVSPADWSIVKELKIASSAITSLRFSRRNERLAIGSSDGIVTLLDPEDDWKIAGEIETSDVGISCIDWSSRHLAVGRFDGTLSVHEASRVYENFFLSEADLTRGDGPVHSVAFGVGGQFLGTCSMPALCAGDCLHDAHLFKLIILQLLAMQVARSEYTAPKVVGYCAINLTLPVLFSLQNGVLMVSTWHSEGNNKKW